MREMNWPPARRAEGLLLDRPHLKAEARAGLGATLVSGDLERALAALAPGSPTLGLYARAPDGPHALRIARDRVLLVTQTPLSAADGWRDGWCAISLDDGWAAIDVKGEDAPLALAQGTAADLETGSPSAAVRFAGLRCLLLRTDAGFRLHVEAPWLTALVTWLGGV